MAQIYTDTQGRRVYDDPQKGTVSATTGQVITSDDITSVSDPGFKSPLLRQPESVSGLSADIPKVEPAPIEQKGDVLSERLQTINESLLGRGAFRREKETEFGVPGAQQAIDDLGVRLRDLERREATIHTEYEGAAAASKGVLEPFVTGEKEVRLRQNAVEALTVSALIDASTNRFTSAQRKVERAVDEKYGPLLEEQAIKLANLEIILKSPAYSRAEKERAEKQKAIEEAKKTQVEKDKTNQAEIWKTATDAVKGGADSVTLENIRSAKTKEEALALAAPFLKKDVNYQFQTLTTEDEFGNKSQRIIALDPSTGKQVGTVSGGGTIVSAPGGVISSDAGTMVDTSMLSRFNPEQQANIIAYAQQYAATGQIPSGMPKWVQLGFISQIAKELPKASGVVVNTTTGIADSKTPAIEQQDYARLFNIINNAKVLKELDKQRVSGIVAGTFGKVFGSEAQGAYLARRKAIVDDMQRMQSGAALTPEETAFYSDYLPGRLSESLFLGQDSQKKIQNFESIMNDRLQQRLANNNLAIYGYSKVNLGGKEYTIGDIIEVNGMKGRVLPDGSVAIIK